MNQKTEKETMSAHDFFEKEAQAGRITNSEKEYLSLLALGMEGELSDDFGTMTKKAGLWKGARAQTLWEGAKNALTGDLGTKLLIGGALTGAVAGARAIKRNVAGPIMEQIRFNRMMNLPGLEINVGSTTIPNYYIDETLPREEQERQVIRRGFGLLNQFAPDVAAVPEIAASTLKRQLARGGDVTDIYDRSMELAQGHGALQKARSYREPNPFWYDDAKQELQVSMIPDSKRDMEEMVAARKMDMMKKDKSLVIGMNDDKKKSDQMMKEWSKLRHEIERDRYERGQEGGGGY